MINLEKKESIYFLTMDVGENRWNTTFVREFSKANGGKAFYTGLDNLGEMIFEDYNSNKKRKI